MNEHLDRTMLDALVSGELSPEERAGAGEHLARCASCTAGALSSAMLKLATAKAGARYVPSQQFAERISRQNRRGQIVSIGTPQRAMLGWATAAVLAVAALISVAMLQRARRDEVATLTRASRATEVLDQHVAALVPDGSLDVVSSDRHTVKPWFQGRLPFSFNLPEALPEGTTLEGANLTYLYGQPAAQLVYGIHKHRASVFVTLENSAIEPAESVTEQAGFQVRAFTVGHLHVQAVSDVSAGDLDALAKAFRESQSTDGMKKPSGGH